MELKDRPAGDEISTNSLALAVFGKAFADLNLWNWFEVRESRDYTMFVLFCFRVRMFQ